MSDQEMKSYDLFAAAALQALITKIELLDKNGEFGRQTTEKELDLIQKEISRSAHSYACHMVKEKKEFTDWLEKEMNKSA